MRLHANAVTCPNSRKMLVARVLGGTATRDVARDVGCSERTVRKWVRRFEDQGPAGLMDRSSAPRRQPRRTAPEREAAITALRRLRMTAAEIAEALDMPLSTVSAVLKRIGLGKRSRLDPLEPPNRYERRHPGELVHVRSSGGSRRDAPGTGFTATAACNAAGAGKASARWAGSTCTSASMTRRAWPTSKFSTMSAA